MLQVTDSAAGVLKKLLAEEPNCRLRIMLSTACTGPSFAIALDESISPADTEINVNEIPFIYPKHVSHYVSDIIIDTHPQEEGGGLFMRSPRFPSGC
jgi:Fe-S cluster assembly iron-binding protein IscA